MSLAVSIVLYHNGDELEEAIVCILQSKLTKTLYLVDNSKTNSLKTLASDPRIQYIFNEENKGYGAAHNIALRKSQKEGIKYHLVMNADITFQPGTLETIYQYMDAHEEVGSIMPKVLYKNGAIQRLCKLLPDPFDLFIRRFLGRIGKSAAKNARYELHHFNYNSILNTPCLSGCFMFLRTSVLNISGLFDERFFMYLEDYDLTRRIHQSFKTLFYPEASIIHLYTQSSYKNWRIFKIHIQSACKYFNKWGWFSDLERNRLNTEVLKSIEKAS